MVQKSFLPKRAEPDGLDTAFSSRNYCMSKISPGGIKPMKSVNPHTKYNFSPKKLFKKFPHSRNCEEISKTISFFVQAR